VGAQQHRALPEKIPNDDDDDNNKNNTILSRSLHYNVEIRGKVSYETGQITPHDMSRSPGENTGL
jgi:hypothetical protein